MSRLIRPEAAVYDAAQEVLGRSLLIYFVFTLSNPFFALLIGVQKVKVTHWIGTASLLIELCGVLALIPAGLTLTRVMWVYSGNAVFGLVFSAVLAKHYFKDLSVSWKYVSWQRLKEIFFYGAQLSTTTLAAILGPVIDKLILARYISLSAVAYYEGAARLIDLLRRATQLFLLPLFPMAGAREEKHTEIEKLNFYVRAFSGNLLVSSALYLIPASLAFGIFREWLGPGSQLGAVVFIVLSITSFSMALVGPLTMILAGTGRLKPLMVAAVIGLFLNLTLSPLLTRSWGFDGLLCGSAVAYGFSSWLFLLWAAKIPEFKIPLKQIFCLCGFAVLAGLSPGIVVSVILRLGEQQGTGLRLLLAIILATGAFVAISLLQESNRGILLRALDHACLGIAAGFGRRKPSNA